MFIFFSGDLKIFQGLKAFEYFQSLPSQLSAILFEVSAQCLEQICIFFEGENLLAA